MYSQLKKVGVPIQFAPRVFAGQLDDWLESGIPPRNELLQAILENDLGHAIALTGSANWPLVHDTLIWLWNFAPPQCHGSQYHTKRWMQLHRRGRSW
jgi:hypothetical protein